jgi:hypothetical protein
MTFCKDFASQLRFPEGGMTSPELLLEKEVILANALSALSSDSYGQNL